MNSAPNMEKASFKEIQGSLPKEPGIYQYFDDKGKLIYVGKAKNIKNRVSSYFLSGQQNAKTTELVQKIKIWHFFQGKSMENLRCFLELTAGIII